MTSVTLDTQHVKQGSNSIKLQTKSGFDTGVRYPAGGGAHWNLTADNFLVFWAYANNQTPIGFQGNQPIIVLNTAGGSYRYEPQHQQMPNQGWQHFFIPLAGSTEWVRTSTGTPSLADVNSVEIHQDTWDSGFDVTYDGLEFVNLSATPGPTPPGVNPDAISPRVLLYIFDPVLENRGGRRTHEVYGWQDPVQLTRQIVADLRTSSHGLVDYNVVDTVVADIHPYYDDGTQLTDSTFVHDIEASPMIFPKGHFDYKRFILENKIIPRIESGDLDEVWVYASPESGMWESAMAGQGAYWINGPTQDVPCARAFPIMGWNYERGVAEAIHSYGHRAEGSMDNSYGGQSMNLDNNWNRFTYQDRYGAGNGGVGNIHFPVNGQSDYDYDNIAYVLSNADDWANYPNLKGIKRSINSSEWSPTHADSQRDYLNWWYSHLPHFAGAGPDGYLNNWWRYITDPDQFKNGTRGNLSGSTGVSLVQIRGPLSGSVVSGLVSLKADVVSDGALGRVDFFVDGQYLGTDTVAPYTINWSTQSWAPGSHIIMAKSHELQHQSESVSDPITLVIGSGVINHAPTLSPMFDRVINEGQSLVFQAVALDPDAGQLITYSLAAGAPAGAFIDPVTGLFSFTPTDGPGSYSVVVRASDNGSPVLHDDRSFSIQVNNVAPTVSLGAGIQLWVGQPLSRVGTFTDPGSDTWTADVNYGDGSGTQTLNVGPGNTLTLSHVYSRAGNYSVSVNVIDKDGGTGHQSLAIQVTTPPAVVQTLTASSTRTGIPALNLTFSQPMSSTRVNSVRLYQLVSAGADLTFGTRDDAAIRLRSVAYNPKTLKLKLTPTQPLKRGKPYQLTVKSASSNTDLIDATGRLLDGDGDGQPGGNFVKRFSFP